MKKVGYSLVVRIPVYYCRSFNILPRDRKGNPGSGFTWARKNSKSLQLKFGNGGKSFPYNRGGLTNVIIPKGLAYSSGINVATWLLFEIDESPKDRHYTSIITIAKTTPNPVPKVVRDTWVRHKKELVYELNEKQNLERKIYSLEDDLKDSQTEVKRLKLRLKLNNVTGPYTPERWVSEFRGEPIYSERELRDRFGNEWWFNPYFVVWAADHYPLLDFSELDILLKELLMDYDFYDWNVVRDIRDDYRPVLERVRNGAHLRNAYTGHQTSGPSVLEGRSGGKQSQASRQQEEGTGHKTRDLVSIKPEWWIEKIRSTWPNFDLFKDRYLIGRFGENWWANPYFIVWGAHNTYTADDSKVISQMAKLLRDYKSHECDVDNDIKIIYGPILENIKNGTSLEKAIVGAPLFGVVTELWQAG